MAFGAALPQTGRMRCGWLGLIAALLCSGCLSWGNASQWDGVPQQVRSWEWILEEGAAPRTPPAVDFLGLDAFDTEAAYVSAAAANGTVWCSLSVGTAEDFRDDWAEFVVRDNAQVDAGEAPILSGELADWPGERWLNAAEYEAFLDLIAARFRMCADKGFAWVELDHMDGYANPAGFAVTEQDARTYVAALVSEAQQRGLGVLHKNAEALIDDLEPSMDGLLMEGCVLDGFCGDGEPFLVAGKPVFDVEYPEDWRAAGRDVDVDAICEEGEAAGANVILKTRELDARTIVCAAR